MIKVNLTVPLEHQPEPVVITPPITDQVPIGIVEDEETLQIRPRRHTIKTPIPGYLRISQKFHRHGPRTVGHPPA